MIETRLKAPSLKLRALSVVVLFAFVAMLMITPPVMAADTGSTTTDEPTIDVSIHYATYDDLDDDGLKNDVYVVLHFSLGYYYYYEVYYWITLELPSGTSYSYRVYMFALSEFVVTHNIFYNYATESGNYTVSVTALLNTPYQASDCAQYTFDPPGGSEGGKPTFGVY